MEKYKLKFYDQKSTILWIKNAGKKEGDFLVCAISANTEIKPNEAGSYNRRPYSQEMTLAEIMSFLSKNDTQKLLGVFTKRCLGLSLEDAENKEILFDEPLDCSMKITIENETPKINGLPNGTSRIFFGKIDDQTGYAVIYSPEDECFPEEGESMLELSSAKVAIGKLDEEMKIFPVKAGHKYRNGGGYVDLGCAGTIGFQKSNPRNSVFNNVLFKEVYMAL